MVSGKKTGRVGQTEIGPNRTDTPPSMDGRREESTRNPKDFRTLQRDVNFEKENAGE